MATLHQILADVLRIPPEAITSELSMHNFSTWNSLTHIELIVALEEEYQIQLTEEEIVSMTNIGDVKGVLNSRGIMV
jgi:acyl carrier protein